MRTIDKDILKLAIPSILANITVPFVGMVDIAVTGHLDANAATLIGGIAIGSMLFDLLYWNFGFLRVGTGGLSAQAFGRGDTRESARILTRSMGIACLCALVLIALQGLFVQAAFRIVDCTPEVRELATRYFFIRIWAAPATLSLMALKGWFIGMQDSVSSMATDLVVNATNIVGSVILALGIPMQMSNEAGPLLKGMGFDGVAWGTVAAQYAGLLVGLWIVLQKYVKRVFRDFNREDLKTVFQGAEVKRFFVLNSNLFVRSLCFIGIYIGFTILSARYGDLLLAVSSIMMKLLMIFSYFTDGFAYAGEAMTGRYIGERNAPMLQKTVVRIFIWSMAVALLFMVIYAWAGIPMLKMMTSDTTVVEAARPYLPWLLLMPLIGCAAFTWDGIYVGATAAIPIRNSMLWAVVAFFAVWFMGLFGFQTFSSLTGGTAIHLLMGAYFAHLIVRTVYLSVHYKTSIKIK